MVIFAAFLPRRREKKERKKEKERYIERERDSVALRLQHK